ncbi:RNA polymerase sporulation sigma factor SigH [Velocimicrobium porci]|uniref:RNA polymerase sporulation sigma factor SigH n=1 Tax=Velocimicrobium porci TaxID=2606634 RepID=UPI002E261890|nr:RNA polymerase sporulation sigma factor SigH [Velocimicrobium porci]
MKQSYNQLTDEQIIVLIRQGDNDAVDFLMDKYKNLVRKRARKLFLIDGDKDDLIQEGMIGLYKAIRDYEPDKKASFYTFADLCIAGQIYSAIKNSNRQKNMPLNTYISFYSPAFLEEYEDMKDPYINFLPAAHKLNPEELVIDKETVSVIEYELGRHLSLLEKEVMNLYMEGYPYTEIAERLERSPKSIDNAIQRVKSKLNYVLKQIHH